MIAQLKDFLGLFAACLTFSFGLVVGAGLGWTVLVLLWGMM